MPVALIRGRHYHFPMRKLLWGVVVLLLLALVPVGVALYLYQSMRSAEEKTVVIKPGSGVRATLAQLHAEGLTPSPVLTVIPLVITKQYHALKAGEYLFAAGSSPADIIAKIIRGEIVIHKVTIPEGWNSWQVRDALMKEPMLTGELPEEIPEGSLKPDTMHFERGEARANVVKRMQDAQQKLMTKLWETRVENLPYQTPAEALIMASIIEKETGVVDERALVAGVFVNRLRIGMALQSDPTVVYGIEHAQGGKPLGRLLARADLQRDTPYNTYTRPGLTPTPICNPGRKAIEAALNPATTNYLYFVATGNGGHHFAATLKEHEANVVAYRKVLREANAASSSNPNSPN